MPLLTGQNLIEAMRISGQRGVGIAVYPKLYRLRQSQVGQCDPGVGIAQICRALNDVVVANYALDDYAGKQPERYPGRIDNHLFRGVRYAAEWITHDQRIKPGVCKLDSRKIQCFIGCARQSNAILIPLKTQRAAAPCLRAQ